MTGLIVTGGESPPAALLRDLFRRSDLVVAADSGFTTIQNAGLMPDFVVGDFDSLQEKHVLEVFPADKVMSFPVDKDYTDTELAIQTARDRGMQDIVIAGGGGGRLDHLLAVYSIFMRPQAPCEWHTRYESCYLIDDTYEGFFCPGKRLSLLPVGPGIAAMESRGLKWPLDSLCWQYGDTGISNVAESEKITIVMKTGKLLLIYEHTAEDRP